MTTDSSDNDLRGCWLTLLVVPLALYGAFAEGFVLSKLWAWYAVPLGAPAVRWQAFAAFGLAYGMLRMRRPGAEPVDARPKMEQASASLVVLAWPWIALLVAWVFR